MSVKTAGDSFIDPSKKKSFEFYQHLLEGFANYEQLGNKLINLLEQSRAARQLEELKEYGLVLSSLPSPTYKAIGQFYFGLSLCQNGSGELDRARTVLETVAGAGPNRYRAEAMISLSSIACVNQKLDETISYCTEAIKLAGVSVTGAKARSGLAILKSFEGYHRFALRDLENLYPVIKYAPPHIYFDYLNSLAVELAHCDRLDEARNVSAIACSSPLVSAYPEWRETANEITLRGCGRTRSIRSIAEKQAENVFKLPLPDSGAAQYRSRQPKPARVLNYLDWKKKMVKESDSKKEIDFKNMTEKEKLFKIIELTSDDDITEEQLDKILDAVLKITSKRD